MTVAGALDAEAATSHNITIRATSSDTSFSTTTLSIAVNDVDEFDTGAVTDADAGANSVAEDAMVGTTVGVTGLATDADVDRHVTYTLDDDAGGLFAIDANTGIVTVAGGLDDETATSHSITIRATSDDGSFATAVLHDQRHRRQRIRRLGRQRHRRGGRLRRSKTRSSAAVVGMTAFANDTDGTERSATRSTTMPADCLPSTPTRAIVTVAGGMDAETATSHDITVRATSDRTSSARRRRFTIAVSDVDEFDTGAVTDSDAGANTVAEDATVGTTVGVTGLAADADVTDTVTYTLDDDAGGLFAIDANTGVVTVAGGLDYETATSHDITVRATSTDGSFATEIFTINVTDVNESGVTAISDTDAAADFVLENSAPGSVVGVTAFADDADGTDTVSYSLDDDAGGRFTIDANTGVVTVAGGIDREAAASATTSRSGPPAPTPAPPPRRSRSPSAMWTSSTPARSPIRTPVPIRWPRTRLSGPRSA